MCGIFLWLKKLTISVIIFEKISQNVTFIIQYSRFHMSHFPTSLPTTAFYPKLGCIQFSLQRLQMLSPAHNDVDNTDDYNRVIGMAQLKALCAHFLLTRQPSSCMCIQRMTTITRSKKSIIN